MKRIKYLLIIPFLIISIHYYFYFTFKNMFVIDDSINPKATSCFLHSTSINAVWIYLGRNELGLQYDSFLLKPLVSLKNYFFNLGKKHLRDDNAEDVVWWNLNNRWMYGYYGNDKEGNNLYIRNLDKEEHKKLRVFIKDSIIRLSSKEVLSLKNDQLDEYMDDLLNAYDISLKSINYLIDEKTKKEQNYLLNKDILLEMGQVYLASKKIFNKEQSKNPIYSKYDKYRLLSYLLYGKILQNTPMNCRDRDIKEFLDYYLTLAEALMINNKKNNLIDLLYKNSFSNDKKQIPIFLLNKLEKECMEHNNDILKIKEITKQIGEKNANR